MILEQEIPIITQAMSDRFLKFIFFSSIVVAMVSWWDNEYVFHLKNFVVLVHEISHALAALLTGNMVDKITIHPNEAGETVVFYGIQNSFPFIISAGYIGPAVLGGIMLNNGFRGSHQRGILFSIGLMILFFTIKFSETGELAFYTGMLFSIIMMIAAWANVLATRVLLVGLGTSLALYSMYDLFDFTRSVSSTDAGILARWLIPESEPEAMEVMGYIVAIFWSMISLGIIYISIVKTFRLDHVQEEHMPGLEQMFPGDITPEVAEWFLSRGLDLNGNPLQPEMTEEKERNHV